MGILTDKVFNYLYDYKFYQGINNSVVSDIPKPTRLAPAYPLTKNNRVDIPDHVQVEKLYSLSAESNDFKFWIYIPDTIIDYPVVQGKDNDEYLTTNMKHQPNQSGTIFLDYRNNAITMTGNNIIYGHQMKDERMFGQNYKFKDEDYLKSHETIYLYSINSVSAWQIFSVFSVEDYKKETDYNGNPVSSYYTTTDFKDSEDYFNFIKYYQEISLVKTDVELNSTDDIITLSTCQTQTGANARFVIMARKVGSMPVQ
jgi:sortase B